MESRLAYRIQELTYGGLSEESVERLDAIADELEGKTPKRSHSLEDRPMAGSRIIKNVVTKWSTKLWRKTASEESCTALVLSRKC